MRHILIAATLAVLVSACAAAGDGGAPSRGAGPTNDAPKVTPLPSGDPYRDDYGY